MRGTFCNEAVTAYLLSPGGKSTNAATAQKLYQLDPEAFGMHDPPTSAQLHRTRVVLEELPRLPYEKEEPPRVRQGPTGTLRKTQPLTCLCFMQKLL